MFIKYILAIIFLALIPPTSQAFKIDTHVWIGQQVINDLEKNAGKVNILLGGRSLSLQVPADVSHAILTNRAAYLMGNIGPDALPDVVVGQTLVHPGSSASTGWRANDWLHHLLVKSKGKPEGMAFTYGYLGHASADVFAHTYVNQYAGDTFELKDETLVEQRHMALEAFISRHLPPLTSSTGAPLGKAWQVTQMNDSLANFIRESLVYDDQVSDQYRNGDFTKHLWAYRRYRDAIDAAANSPAWETIDKAVLQAVAQYYNVTLSNSEATAIYDLANEILQRVNGSGGIVELTNAQVKRFDDAAIKMDHGIFLSLNGFLNDATRIHRTIINKLAERAVAWDPCTRLGDVCVGGYVHAPTWNDPFRTVCLGWAKDVCPGNIVAAVADIDNQIVDLREKLRQKLIQIKDQADKTRQASANLIYRLAELKRISESNTSP
ncbi:MAG: zinc dependent phospholipase C family protein, partial [Pseudomonadota bacterium]